MSAVPPLLKRSKPDEDHTPHPVHQATPVALSQGAPEAACAGLHFSQAIEAHHAWKQRVLDTLSGDGCELLDAAEARRSDRCILGQWINGQARQQYHHLPEYAAVVRAHTKFHLAASAALVASHAENHEEVGRILDDVQCLSDQCQLELRRLFAKAVEMYGNPSIYHSLLTTLVAMARYLGQFIFIGR